MFDLSIGTTMFELIMATVMVCVTIIWTIGWIIGLIEEIVLDKKKPTGGDMATLAIAIFFSVVFSVTLAIVIIKRYGNLGDML